MIKSKVDDASILAVLAAFAAYESMRSFSEHDERFGFMRLVDAAEFFQAAASRTAEESLIPSASDIGRMGGKKSKRSKTLSAFFEWLYRDHEDKTPSVLWKKAIKLTKGSEKYIFQDHEILFDDDRLFAYPDRGETLKPEGRGIVFSSFEKIIQELNRKK